MCLFVNINLQNLNKFIFNSFNPKYEIYKDLACPLAINSCNILMSLRWRCSGITFLYYLLFLIAIGYSHSKLHMQQCCTSLNIHFAYCFRFLKVRLFYVYSPQKIFKFTNFLWILTIRHFNSTDTENSPRSYKAKYLNRNTFNDYCKTEIKTIVLS